jgi:hypothetical protein
MMGEKAREALTQLQTDYELMVRPYVDALGLNDPGEKEWHGYPLKWDDAVDLAMKDPTFFHVHLAIQLLRKMIGRLNHLKGASHSKAK